MGLVRLEAGMLDGSRFGAGRIRKRDGHRRRGFSFGSGGAGVLARFLPRPSSRAPRTVTPSGATSPRTAGGRRARGRSSAAHPHARGPWIRADSRAIRDLEDDAKAQRTAPLESVQSARCPAARQGARASRPNSSREQQHASVRRVLFALRHRSRCAEDGAPARSEVRAPGEPRPQEGPAIGPHECVPHRLGWTRSRGSSPADSLQSHLAGDPGRASENLSARATHSILPVLAAAPIFSLGPKPHSQSEPEPATSVEGPSLTTVAKRGLSIRRFKVSRLRDVFEAPEVYSRASIPRPLIPHPAVQRFPLGTLHGGARSRELSPTRLRSFL